MAFHREMLSVHVNSLVTDMAASVNHRAAAGQEGERESPQQRASAPRNHLAEKAGRADHRQ